MFIMVTCINSLVYLLSRDYYFDIDRNISTPPPPPISAVSSSHKLPREMSLRLQERPETQATYNTLTSSDCCQQTYR